MHRLPRILRDEDGRRQVHPDSGRLFAAPQRATQHRAANSVLGNDWSLYGTRRVPSDRCAATIMESLKNEGSKAPRRLEPSVATLGAVDQLSPVRLNATYPEGGTPKRGALALQTTLAHGFAEQEPLRHSAFEVNCPLSQGGPYALSHVQTCFVCKKHFAQKTRRLKLRLVERETKLRRQFLALEESLRTQILRSGDEARAEVHSDELRREADAERLAAWLLGQENSRSRFDATEALRRRSILRAEEEQRDDLLSQHASWRRETAALHRSILLCERDARERRDRECLEQQERMSKERLENDKKRRKNLSREEESERKATVAIEESSRVVLCKLLSTTLQRIEMALMVEKQGELEQMRVLRAIEAQMVRTDQEEAAARNDICYDEQDARNALKRETTAECTDLTRFLKQRERHLLILHDQRVYFEETAVEGRLRVEGEREEELRLLRAHFDETNARLVVRHRHRIWRMGREEEERRRMEIEDKSSQQRERKAEEKRLAAERRVQEAEEREAERLRQIVLEEQEADRTAALRGEEARRAALCDTEEAAWRGIQQDIRRFAEDYLPALAAVSALEEDEAKLRAAIEEEAAAFASSDAALDVLADIDTLAAEKEAALRFADEQQDDAWLLGIDDATEAPLPPPAAAADTTAPGATPGSGAADATTAAPSSAAPPAAEEGAAELQDTDGMPGGGEGGTAAPQQQLQQHQQQQQEAAGGAAPGSDRGAAAQRRVDVPDMQQDAGGDDPAARGRDRRKRPAGVTPERATPSPNEREDVLDLGPLSVWVQGCTYVPLWPTAAVSMPRHPSLDYFVLTARFVSNASPCDRVCVCVAEGEEGAGQPEEGDRPTSHTSLLTVQEEGLFAEGGAYLGQLSFQPAEGLLTYRFESTNGHVLQQAHLQNVLSNIVFRNVEVQKSIPAYKLLIVKMEYRGTPKPLKKGAKQAPPPRVRSVEKRMKLSTLPPLLERHRKLPGPKCIDTIMRVPGNLLKGALVHPLMQYPEANGGQPYVKVALQFVSPKGHEHWISDSIDVFSLGADESACDAKDHITVKSRFCSVSSKTKKVIVGGESASITEGSLVSHSEYIEVVFKAPKPGTVSKFVDGLQYDRKDDAPGNTYIRVVKVTVTLQNEYQQDAGSTSALVVVDLLGASRGGVLHAPSIATAYRLPHAGVGELHRAKLGTPHLMLYPDALLCTTHSGNLPGGTIMVEGVRKMDDVRLLASQPCSDPSEVMVAPPSITVCPVRFHSPSITCEPYVPGQDEFDDGTLGVVGDVLSTLRLRADGLRQAVGTKRKLKPPERSGTLDSPRGAPRDESPRQPGADHEGAGPDVEDAKPEGDAPFASANPDGDAPAAEQDQADVPPEDGRAESVSSGGVMDAVYLVYVGGELCAIEMVCAQRLYIGLIPDACSTSTAQTLVRHLAFSCDGSKTWKKSRGKREITLAVDFGLCDAKGARLDPMHVSTVLRVSSPMLNSTSSLGQNVTKTYREQADPIPLGPFDLIDQSADELFNGAYVEIEIVSGCEDTDVFSLRGCTAVEGPFQLQGVDLGFLTCRSGYLRVDFASTAEQVAASATSPLVPEESGRSVERGGVDYVQSAGTHVVVNPAASKRTKCTTGGWIVRMNPHLASVLKALCYRNTSQNPQALSKLLNLRIYDGGRGMALGMLEVDVIPVYDVTELHVDSTELVYRQSGGRSEGFSILPGAALSDPDTTDFRKGRVSFELVCGGDGNDKIDFITLEQQHLRYQRQRRSNPEAGLKADVKANKKRAKKPAAKAAKKDTAKPDTPDSEDDSKQDITDAGDTEELKPWSKVMSSYLTANGIAIDEGYADAQFKEGVELWVALIGNMIAVNGVPIAVVSFKGSGLRGSHPIAAMIAFNCAFTLPLHVVSYMLRCVCYESTSTKLSTHQRLYQVKLNACDAPVTDTRLRVQINVNSPTIWAPAFSSSFKYRENAGVRAINQHIKFTIPSDLSTGAVPNAANYRVTQGWLVVTLLDSVDLNDVLCFDAGSQWSWSVVPQAPDETVRRRRSSAKRASVVGEEAAGQRPELLVLTYTHIPGERRSSLAESMPKGDEVVVGLIEGHEKQEMKIRFLEQHPVCVRHLTQLLHSIAFCNDSDDPAVGARTVEMRLFEDRDDQFGCAVSTIVDVFATDDLTEVSIPEDRHTYVLGGEVEKLNIAADAVVTDPDTHVFNGPDGYLHVSFLSGFTKSDSLTLSPTCSDLTVEPNEGTVMWKGDVVAVFSKRYSAYGREKFRLLFRTASLEAVQEMVRAVAYSNTAKRDHANSRCVALHLKDGKASQTTRVNVNVSILEPFLDITGEKVSRALPLAAVRVALPGLQDVTVKVEAHAYSATDPPVLAEWPDSLTLTAPLASFGTVSEGVLRLRKQVIGGITTSANGFQMTLNGACKQSVSALETLLRGVLVKATVARGTDSAPLSPRGKRAPEWRVEYIISITAQIGGQALVFTETIPAPQ